MEPELIKKLIQMIEQANNMDSIEIGTPSKGGALKFYFNASDPEEAKRRADNAQRIRAYAQCLYDGTIKPEGE